MRQLTLICYGGVVLIYTVLLVALYGCGGDGGDSAGQGVEITYCFLGDQVVAVDSDGNVMSTRPLEENEENFYEDAGRVLLRIKVDGLPSFIAQCGADVTIQIESESTTTAVTTTGTVSVGGAQ